MQAPPERAHRFASGSGAGRSPAAGNIAKVRPGAAGQPEIHEILRMVTAPIADEAARQEVRKDLECRPGLARQRTGTALALAAPRPPGHPLGDAPGE
jgi:hypothetical protein